MKKFLHELNNAWFTRMEPVYLINFITQRCNASCPHCFLDFNKKYEEMDVGTYEKIAKTSLKSLRSVALTGGEPFLRDDVYDIADVWWKNSTAKTISITTNGSFPDKIKTFCVSAQKNNMNLAFFFSYDFIGEKHSEYRRVKDLHLKVLESYEIVKKFSHNATFTITINPNNTENIEEIYDYILNDLKVSNINCALFRGEKANVLDKDVRLKIANKYEKIQKRIDRDYELGILEGFKDNSLTDIALNTKNKIIWKYMLDDFLYPKYKNPCFAGSLLAVVLPNGDVYPCELLDEKLGNLKSFDNDFSKLWESSAACQFRKQLKAAKCHCTYECAWMLNIFALKRFLPEITYEMSKNFITRKVLKCC
jgi:radical SAM protein with 4Fe4S-binding SPASM domain